MGRLFEGKDLQRARIQEEGEGLCVNFCIIICMNILLPYLHKEFSGRPEKGVGWESMGQILSLSHIRIVDWEMQASQTWAALKGFMRPQRTSINRPYCLAAGPLDWV